MRAVDWSDNARDIIQFLAHYRPFLGVPEQYYKATLPVHLPRVPEAVASQQLSKGIQGAGGASRLVAIGHSFGGCSLYDPLPLPSVSSG